MAPLSRLMVSRSPLSEPVNHLDPTLQHRSSCAEGPSNKGRGMGGVTRCARAGQEQTSIQIQWDFLPRGPGMHAYGARDHCYNISSEARVTSILLT